MRKPYEIAVIYGDGIGPEIGSATVEVLKAALKDDNILNFIEYPAGAQCFLDTGEL